MALYKFDEIYYRVTGEYENGIQILFFESEGKDILVYDGVFNLVNKPVQLNLSGYNRFSKANRYSFNITKIAHKYSSGDNRDCVDETYLLFDRGAIKIDWYFSTASGQQEKGFWIYFEEENKEQFDACLKAIQSAREMEIYDYRFI